MDIKKLHNSINAKRDKLLVDLINREGPSIETYMHDVETFVSTLEWKFSFIEVATLYQNKIAFSNIENRTFLKNYFKMLDQSKKNKLSIKPNEYKIKNIKQQLSDYWKCEPPRPKGRGF